MISIYENLHQINLFLERNWKSFSIKIKKKGQMEWRWENLNHPMSINNCFPYGTENSLNDAEAST